MSHQPELAPLACIVCNKPKPEKDDAGTWTYFAGVTPIGALTCSQACTDIAIERYTKTGRVDLQGKKP